MKNRWSSFSNAEMQYLQYAILQLSSNIPTPTRLKKLCKELNEENVKRIAMEKP